jgi:hypothetical protein
VSFAFTDSATGWSGTCVTGTGLTSPPPGGLVLQDVRHDGHSFARDIRMIGIWLKVEEVTPAGAVARTFPPVFVPLSNPPFAIGPLNTLTPAPFTPSAGGATIQYLREAAEVPQFDTYFRNGANYVAYGFSVDYTLPAPWFSGQWANCEVSQLWIAQRFLFSRYAHDPRHEPSGALDAARFHPVSKYAFTKNSAVNRSVNYQRIASIRFDYRLQLKLDRHYDLATNRTLPQLGQSTGLFRDNDSISLSTSIARTVFAAIEKPLVLEVWAYGLWQGAPIVGPRTGPTSGTERTWDNLHWWGAKATGDPIISAPGAFHAAHCHWRWGAAGSSLRPTYPEIDTGGVPAAVSGRPWGTGAMRVLVDPNVWIQTIRVAIAKNDASLDPNAGAALTSLSRDAWETLFTPGLRATPDDIYAGAEIVYWYSTEVHSSTTFPPTSTPITIGPVTIPRGSPAATYASKLEGSVFIHGFFFAHNAEQGGAAVGATTPEHWPRTVAALRASPTWYRPAS